MHVQVTDAVEVYGLVENLFDEEALLGRLPYGARPNKDRSATVGVRIRL